MGIFDTDPRDDVNHVAVTVLPLINSSINACLLVQHVSAQDAATPRAPTPSVHVQ